MSKTGRKSSSSSNKSSSNAAASSSVVEQLKMLRACVGTESIFTETDLSTCLREAGYRVDLAAERLLTGQYQPRAKRVKTTTNSFFAQNRKRPPSSTSSSSTTSTSRGASTQTPTRHHSRPAPPPPRQTTARQHTQKPATTTPSVVTPKTTTTPAVHDSFNNNSWLLCQRWVSDATCTQRNASLRYQERLQVSCMGGEDATTKLLVKFRGNHCQGQLPKQLTYFLHPLLLAHFIQIETSALLEERRLPMGAQLPLSLVIWISNPTAFFALFDQAKRTSNSTSKKLFFQKSDKTTTSSSVNNNNKVLSKDPNERLAQAAFQLLQWAQHGEQAILELFNNNNDTTNPEAGDKSSANEETSDEEEILLDSSEEENLVETSSLLETKMDQLETTTAATGGDKKQLAELKETIKVTLRPYQRQALWWMVQRENEQEQEEWSLQRLELLKDLQNSNTAAKTTSALSPFSNGASKNPILCDDCGPVWVNLAYASAPPVQQLHEGSTNEETTTSNAHHHPLWERRYLASRDRQRALSFYVQPLFGVASPNLPPPPQPCRGGILADSMGLGKTVMLLALIQQYPGTTLIVTPLSLLTQWEEELTSKTSLSYQVYYGPDKKNKTLDLAAVNVVLTTYGTLQAELVSQNKKRRQQQQEEVSSPIFGHFWTRIILDEAHCIKNTMTVASRACCLLQAERRWCVSGTIIQNSLDDVYALLKFLRHEPWCEPSFWKAAISSQTPDVALERVRRVLVPILLRRTKDSLDVDGQPILKLPPIDAKTILVTFSPAERQFYDALHRKSLDLFQGFLRAGTASKSWLTIFSLLHRLRQTCDHVALTVKAHQDQDEWDSNIANQQEQQAQKRMPEEDQPSSAAGNPSDTIDQRFLDDLMKKFKAMESGSNKQDGKALGDESYASNIANMLNDAVQNKSSALEEECSICLDPINICESVVTPCFHLFCKDCLVDVLRGRSPSNTQESSSLRSQPILKCPKGPCPVCTEEIDPSKILRITKSEEGAIQTDYLLSSTTTKKPAATKKPVAAASNQAHEDDGAARQALETAVQGSTSAKLAAILKELDNVWNEDPGSKVLIFSQFLGFLDLIGQSCKLNKIPTSRLDGKLSLKERMRVLDHFGSTKKTSDVASNGSKVGSVLLISMKAGGVGLNLVAASTVFIVDPWWNAAVEDQCVDRIHRWGQTAAKVRIRKFCVMDSVEERILELQKRKKNMATRALCDKGATGGAGSGSKPTMDDLKILFGS